MFSALRRLTGGNDRGSGSDGPNKNSTVHTMSSTLQKKFSRGVQYNMKIILKGDRNSGKTCLFRRLQGLPFLEEYVPTEEIQVANIQWNYKATDDIVKVEIWDVVDKAKKKKVLPGASGLKLENTTDSINSDKSPIEEIALDASFLDVYKNTNGVILVFDITKNWTFDYVKREIALIPKYIPVLILANHRDMGHHGAISGDTVPYFIESLEREPESAEVRFCESSMRNGFGLKFIHKFFNLPFLQLQRETLLKQLETNAEENFVTVQELNFYQESDDANYDLFIDSLSQKRRQAADSMGPPIPKMSLAEAQALALEKQKEKDKANLGLKESIIKIVISDASQVPTPSNSGPSSGTSNVSGLNQTSNSKDSNANPSPLRNVAAAATATQKSGTTGVVDEFVPEGEEAFDKYFLGEDSSSTSTQDKRLPETFGSSDEEGGEANNSGNPMVAAYEEDIEEFFSSRNPPTAATITTLVSSSSENEAEPPEELPETNTKPKITASRTNSSTSQKEKDHSSHSHKSKKSSKHSSKSKHKKSSSSGKHKMDLEHFLNGSDSEKTKENIDLSAYEAL